MYMQSVSDYATTQSLQDTAARQGAVPQAQHSLQTEDAA